jgi:hypothetical protein
MMVLNSLLLLGTTEWNVEPSEGHNIRAPVSEGGTTE